MEARGYIPGAKRTKLNIMKFNVNDIFGFAFSIGVFVSALLFMVI